MQFLHFFGVQILHSFDVRILHAGEPEGKFFLLAYWQILHSGLHAKTAFTRTCKICTMAIVQILHSGTDAIIRRIRLVLWLTLTCHIKRYGFFRRKWHGKYSLGAQNPPGINLAAVPE